MALDLGLAPVHRPAGVDDQTVVGARLVRAVEAGVGLAPGGDAAAALGRIGADGLDDDVRDVLGGGQADQPVRAAATGLTASAITVIPRRRWAAARSWATL
jgi:hypothetical protein